MLNNFAPERVDDWLKAQIASLDAWMEELRVENPIRFRREICRIDEHRSWLQQQLDQFSHEPPQQDSPF